MNHPDEGELAGLAAGDLDPAVESHVAACADCAVTLDTLRRTVTAVRGAAAVERVEPPESVWAAISAQVQADGRPAPLRALPDTAPHEHPDLQTPAADPRDARSSRKRWVAIGAGFLVGAAAATAVTVAVTHDSTTPATPAPVVVAEGRLDPFDGSTVSGTARMTTHGDARQVTVELTGAPTSSDDFVQAWLLDPATNGMVALGVVDASTQTFAVPAGLDLDAYDSVDISLEPFDGNPAHSATSLARGVMTAP